MAQSKLALYNMALSACGADYTLTDPNQEVIPAAICNLWYESARQTVLRASHWNVAKRFARLTKERSRAVVTGYTSTTGEEWVDTDPQPGYAFSYTLPDEMLYARFLTDFDQFEIGYADDKKILSANYGGPDALDVPVLCYTTDVDDVTLWEPDLYQAVAYGLAGHICMPLHGKPSRAAQQYQLANGIIIEANTNSANEMHQKLTQMPERLQARGYAGGGISSPYIYPHGNMFVGTGAAVV